MTRVSFAAVNGIILHCDRCADLMDEWRDGGTRQGQQSRRHEWKIRRGSARWIVNVKDNAIIVNVIIIIIIVVNAIIVFYYS